MKILKNLMEQINKLNGKYGIIIKIYLIISFILFLVVTTIFIIIMSYKPLNVPVFDGYIDDIAVLDQILIYLQEEGVDFHVTRNGIIFVKNNKTARRMRTILTERQLAPTELEHWIIWETNRNWRNITNVERNINLQLVRNRIIQNQIKAIDGIHDALLTIVYYPNVTANLIIVPELESDIVINQQKIENIQNFLINSIEGLKSENIMVVDQSGYVINLLIKNME